MLKSLHIRDLALIEHAELRLAPGLNVLSGETGGGKSLVVAALHLLRGGKAAAGLVRHGAAELRVDGEFELEEGERSRAVAAQVAALCGFELEEDELLLTRIVDAGGRSRARVAGRPVPLAVLRELGSWLVEIHGQGESRALMRPEVQSEILDAFAGSAALREAFARDLDAARAAAERLRRAGDDQGDRRARAELLGFQVREIDELALGEGELEGLEDEHRILQHQDQLREEMERALQALQDAEPCASDLLGTAAAALAEAARIDRSLEAAAETLAEGQERVADAARALQSRLADLEHDPQRLAVVAERLDAVRKLLRRFGPTEPELRRRRAELAEELTRLEDDLGGPERLEAELAERRGEAVRAGGKLARARCKAAGRFAKAIEAELGDLGMRETRIEVRTEESVDAASLLERATRHGPSPVEILVRINPGEPATPLRETASGGELARIVLALKKCLADKDRVPLVAFDEIDAEIGGRLGLAVGSKLREVAASHQVLFATHLPQVAAFAAAHFKVGKQTSGGRTVASIALLEPAEVERELAAMAVGEGVDAEALQEARRLVVRARGA